MEENLFNLENISESMEVSSETTGAFMSQETVMENLELAKNEGNVEAVAYYEKKLVAFSVEDKLNDTSDIVVGSCADFCRRTSTNSSGGNYGTSE